MGLAWSREAEQAVEIATEAAVLLAATEADAAAADYLAEATAALWFGTFSPRADQLAEQGLRHIGSRLDLTWANLTLLDVHRREVADPAYPGIALDSPERRAAIDIVLERFATLSRDDRELLTDLAARSRAEVLERQGDDALTCGRWHWRGKRAAISKRRGGLESSHCSWVVWRVGQRRWAISPRRKRPLPAQSRWRIG